MEDVVLSLRHYTGRHYTRDQLGAQAKPDGNTGTGAPGGEAVHAKVAR